MTAAYVRSLIASHLVVFGLGFYVGKRIDSDELNMYRAANESFFTRIRRQAGTAVVATSAIGILWLAVRVATRPKPSME